MRRITEEQCYTLGSFLRTAQGKFEEFSRALREDPTSPAQNDLAKQFDRQAREAQQFAVLFESAEGAEVQIGPEEL